MNEQSNNEYKSIREHLANERTYLAWIRTAIAIIGIGFLATTLHFNINKTINPLGDLFAIIVSLSSLVIGVLTIIGSTINYYRTRRNINKEEFRSSHGIIIYMTFTAIVIFFLIIAYFFLV
ncbi:YidH family protein [Pontibacillus marinus]|uniref:DUF202 domain-containing protein n=1 Tax=Pontibacillus marinus BH030004 = DSM 16465 TaxID=1385511 RepID=A0A0A5G448_9BACI|nr:DUF202 domain-containing protein [Pontibacillus marinus]KGX85908.1 hypothetical protein N783_13025 [Pontibacillus marinus BH030004 = DSM 16465]